METLRIEFFQGRVKFLEYPTPLMIKFRTFSASSLTKHSGSPSLYTLDLLTPGIPTQPSGSDYPCLVFEMANTERMVDMLRKCELWLSDQTAVNLWIGVSYERNHVVGDHGNRVYVESYHGVFIRTRLLESQRFICIDVICNNQLSPWKSFTKRYPPKHNTPGMSTKQ